MATTHPTDPILVLGGGPAGMACALALHTAGQPVLILERYREARPAGNILNLWPPPLKALREIGVDMSGLGAANHSTFQNSKGHVRADVRIPADIVEEYGGGFIGLLRPDLYRRMLAALPEGMLRTDSEVTGIEDRGHDVLLTLKSGERLTTPLLIGADGIDSIVRRQLWGDSPKREHKLHIIGGYTFDPVPEAQWGELPLIHSRTVQGTYSSIRSEGREGYQWWVLEAWNPKQPAPADLLAHAEAARRAVPGGAARAGGRDDGGPRAALADPRPQAAEAVVQGSRSRWPAMRHTRHRPTPRTAPGCRSATGTSSASGSSGVDLADTAAVEAALQGVREAAHPAHDHAGAAGVRPRARSSITPRRRCGRSATSCSTTRRSCRSRSASGARARSSRSSTEMGAGIHAAAR